MKNYKNNSNYIKGELYSNKNFDINNYFNETYESTSFAFINIKENLNYTNEFLRNYNKKYSETSEEIVSRLMDNYSVFTNIAKHITKIDESVTCIMSSEKNYSILLQNLRRDIEEFNLNYNYFDNFINKIELSPEDKIETKDKKLVMEYFNTSHLECNNSFYLNDDYIEYNIEEFINPKVKSKRWLKEVPELIKVLVDEKNFEEALKVIFNIRNSDIYKVNYIDKIKIDESYNFLIENIILNMSKLINIEDIKKYSEMLIFLNNNDSIAKECYLMWISKIIKIKIVSILGHNNDKIYNSNIYDNNLDTKDIFDNLEIKIINVIKMFIENIDSYLEEMHNFFILCKAKLNTDITNKLNKKLDYNNKFTSNKILENNNLIIEDSNFEISIIDWKKKQFQYLMENLSYLFFKINNTKQLKCLVTFFSSLKDDYNNKGISNQFIYNEFFIINLKLSLESITTNCIKEKGSAFQIKNYSHYINRNFNKKNNNIDNNINDYIKLNFTNNFCSFNINEENINYICNKELGIIISKIFELIIEFINQFTVKSDIVVHLEIYFFDILLTDNLINYISFIVNQALNYNEKVNSFSDNVGDLPPPNQILLNYAISLTNIVNALDNFLSKILILENYNKDKKIFKIVEFRNFLVDMHIKFLIDLFRKKIEWHFFKSFDLNKKELINNIPFDKLNNDMDLNNEEQSNLSFKKLDYLFKSSICNNFLNFFYLIKSLVKCLKFKEYNEYTIKTIILDSQLIVFLNTLHKIIEINKLYDTEFTFFDIGIKGLEAIIYGIYFIKNAFIYILGFKLNNNDYKIEKLKILLNEEIDNFINNNNPTKIKNFVLTRKDTTSSFLVLNSLIFKCEENLKKKNINYINEKLNQSITTKSNYSVNKNISDMLSSDNLLDKDNCFSDNIINLNKENLINILISDLIKLFCKNNNMQEDRFFKNLKNQEKEIINYIALIKHELE